jgi:L-serine dehydratase
MIVSIFNDVIGPVMRGPSSSHCAAALRIGRLARNLMDNDLQDIRVEFDPAGSLATTHASQGSDMGLFGGLLGWDAADERLPNSDKALADAGIQVCIEIKPIGASHPNTYRLVLSRDGEQHVLTAISTGGGMIEVIELDGFAVSMVGDYSETLLYTDTHGPEIVEHLRGALPDHDVLLHGVQGKHLVEIKTPQPVDAALLQDLNARFSIEAVKQLEPVLPVLSRRGLTVPFTSCEQMLAYKADRDRPLWQLGLDYETVRGDLTEEAVLARMVEIVKILRASVSQGLQGTEYEDRILGPQAGGFTQHLDQGHLLDAGLLNRIIPYVTALMEVKSSMGVIVAAPTAGACAALPGTCLAAGDVMGRSDEDVARALVAAGVIGVFVATESTFAAEVAGCQAECGAAAGMAAAALVTLGGGTTEQAVAAASMALQNSLGMVCDPVANRVEVPCLGKNVMAASNALSCANMAMAGYDQVIPLDEVIKTLDRVGKSLPHELRCTALGGLSVTLTSKSIEKTLKDKNA